MQREYEEFKIRINALVSKALKCPEEGWVMQDGTPWPGNNTRDHPGMIQVKKLVTRMVTEYAFSRSSFPEVAFVECRFS